jgi:hypothetical protein
MKLLTPTGQFCMEILNPKHIQHVYILVYDHLFRSTFNLHLANEVPKVCVFFFF